MMVYPPEGIANPVPDAEISRSSSAASVRVERQRRITGNRSKLCNMLILGKFGAFARTREVPKRCWGKEIPEPLEIDWILSWPPTGCMVPASGARAPRPH